MGFVGSYVWKLRQALGSQRILIAGVNAMILNAEDKIWLGKRLSGGEWCYMGGSVEIGQSLMDAVIAETYEETGLQTMPDDWTYAGVHSHPQETFYTYPGGDEVQAVNHLFFMRYEGTLQNGADEEHSEFGLFDLDNLPSPMKPDAVPAIKLLKAFLQTGKVQVR
ncbi:MAG: NUDIX domain-containing protein [Blastochloris viridis]|uniref:NUDIX domain-containing protein n=1 Tax=Blastochloris viridis TaxID=1079 RepID=A0A6N4RC41_BLAVI|nr:MAG: NUDIX domain-containing protein [Blastochloris viridis]